MWYKLWVYGFDWETQQVFSLKEPTISIGGGKKSVGWGKQVPSSVTIMLIVCMTFMELCITNLYHKHKL